jgi:hypothetical protein
MTLPGSAPDAPARKRAAWSFRTLVEEVSGRPLADFQESATPVSGSPRGPSSLHRAPGPSPSSSPSTPPSPAAAPLTASTPEPEVVAIPAQATDVARDEEVDPVGRVYPPLAGATGRGLHGADAEHHPETLLSVAPPSEAPAPGSHPHAPGPSRRPERIYLHYLLLHLDRLQDGALRYLKQAVDEELAGREQPSN